MMLIGATTISCIIKGVIFGSDSFPDTRTPVDILSLPSTI